jgi:DNA polymerase-3 subunit delta'
MPAVIGHEKIAGDLKKLIKEGHLSHGYIFYGASMLGKRTTALAIAHFLEKGTFQTAGEGEVLQDAKLIDLAFAKQLDPDIKDSVGIDAVREIKNFLWQRPNVSQKRTLVIDDAELLTVQAQNALLKITEEPPASSLLIIVTSDEGSLMGTIQSRLQKVYFGAVPEKDIAEWLVNDHALTQAKAAAFAKRAIGKPGLAWKLAYDETFRNNLELAERFLKTPPALRKDFIKKLLEPEEFNLRTFLDALIINLAWERSSKAKAALWHKTLLLYQNANNFSLNPRLQLESLLMN